MNEYDFDDSALVGQRIHEMFADPESSEDRTKKVRPEDDRAIRALQEFWDVAGSLLATEKSLAKAALAMVSILEAVDEQ